MICKTMLKEIIFGLVLCFSTINADKRITLRPYFELRSSIDWKMMSSMFIDSEEQI